MTLAERIKLIDAMILEDSDYTIRDYLELVKDIEVIERTNDNSETNNLKWQHGVNGQDRLLLK